MHFGKIKTNNKSDDQQTTVQLGTKNKEIVNLVLLTYVCVSIVIAF